MNANWVQTLNQNLPSKQKLATGLVLSLLLAPLVLAPKVQAGVFNLPNFVPQKEFALGLEPEVTLSNQSGVGVNFKYQHGLSDMNNLMVTIGTGTNNRQFRLGGAFTFDFFPDVDDQPGIGLALQGLFVQLANAGSVEITAIPYIHKKFIGDGNQFEPFLAIPLGISLSGGAYQPLATLAIGSMLHHSQHMRTIIEVGVGLTNVSTYISGGLTYYY